MLNCTTCHQTKPESEYYRQKNGRGYAYACKDCRRAYEKARPKRHYYPGGYVKKVLTCNICHLPKPSIFYSLKDGQRYPTCNACILKAGKAVCSHCHELKSIDQFFKNRTHYSGHHNYCKQCFTVAEREHMARSGKRRVNAQRAIAMADPVRGPVLRGAINERQRLYRLLHWEEVHARWYVDKQKKLKILTAPDACQYCKETGPVEAHHHKGYAPANWLDVHWICHECHTKTRTAGYVERVLHYTDLDKETTLSV
jgi:hypothetical protein